MKLSRKQGGLRTMLQGSAAQRIAAVALVVAVALTYGGGYYGSAAEALPVDTDLSVGLSVPEGEVLPGVDSARLQAILLTSPYYSDELFEWTIISGPACGDRFEYAVRLLMQYPTEDEATAFLHLMDQLRQNTATGGVTEGAAAATGYDRAATELANRVGSRISAAERNEEPGGTFDKAMRKDDRFRHYQVELSFRPSEVVKAISDPSDVVILIDASESMAGQRLTSAKSVAVSLVRETFRQNDRNRVGVIVYRDDSVVVSTLSNHLRKGALINEINAITAAGGSNRQSGILSAGQMLEAAGDTGSGSTARRKIAVDLTDGGANLAVTDNWAYGYDSSGSLAENHKRWSYAAGRDYLNPAIATSYWSEAKSSGGNGAKLAALESQYLVAKGVDLFVIDYSGGNAADLLLSTYPMTNAPTTFAYGFSSPEATRVYNPVATVGYRTEGYAGRVIQGNSGADLVDGMELIFGEQTLEKSVPTFTISDNIDIERFELVDEPVVSGGGMDEGEIAYDPATGRLDWFSAGEDSDRLRQLTYTIRVLDEPLYPEGAGDYAPQDGETMSVAADSIIMWEAEDGTIEQKLTYEFDISVESLLTASAWALNASGEEIDRWVEGRDVLLTGSVENGSGQYDCQWYRESEPVGEPFGLDGSSHFGETIDFDLPTAVSDLPNGVTHFTLRVTDVQAEKAGYTAETVAWVEVPVEVTVAYGTVHIRIEGPEGNYETRVTASDRKGNTDWYLLGTGERSYEFAAGTTVSAQAYAPPGFTVTGRDSVQLVPNANGMIPEQTIVLQITPVERRYIHNWVGNRSRAESNLE